jgi:hypothetical protein
VRFYGAALYSDKEGNKLEKPVFFKHVTVEQCSGALTIYERSRERVSLDLNTVRCEIGFDNLWIHGMLWQDKRKSFVGQRIALFATKAEYKDVSGEVDSEE